ncbi:MAG: endonuclease/exonuclease/phosphatase family protein [Rikenellaceae bacterium]
MKRVVKILCGVVVVVSLLFAALLITEWRPKDVERRCFDVGAVNLPDTLTIVTWNIGYAGLGDDMDFFYDGGTKTRTSEQRANENLDAIIAQLRKFDYADFILLQEVDFDSHRSYHVNQQERICEALVDYPYYAVALNYSSPFVPVPISEPMGGVKSGVMTLSKYQIFESVRWQYPTIPDLPNRLFDLKRCMLAVGIKAQNGGVLWVNNTHNTAFDTGGMRECEIQYIGNILQGQKSVITAGDWNSTPPGYTPSKGAMENEFFTPLPLERGNFPDGFSAHYGENSETVRFLDCPYTTWRSTTSVIDFAVLSTSWRILECKTLDLGFKNSDHNPVVINVIAND